MSPQKASPKKEVLDNFQAVEENHLVLFNDEINTFDYVIDSLMEVCKHERHQAEQCSIIVHHNGKCGIKQGEYKKLKPMREALADRGLSVVIE